MDSVMHFEIPVQDVNRASEFYKKNFGWDINDIPEMEYHTLTTTETGKDRMPKQIGAINGGMMMRSNKIKSPVITINVADIDKAIEKVKASGGSILIGKTTVGKIGYSAYFKDSEGNIMGLFQRISV
jgi:uncharacterized protein